MIVFTAGMGLPYTYTPALCQRIPALLHSREWRAGRHADELETALK